VQISALYKTHEVLEDNINAWNPKVQCGFDLVYLALKPFISIGAIAMHVCLRSVQIGAYFCNCDHVNVNFSRKSKF